MTWINTNSNTIILYKICIVVPGSLFVKYTFNVQYCMQVLDAVSMQIHTNNPLFVKQEL